MTASDKGCILVWDLSLIVDGVAQPNERRLIKVVVLNGMNNEYPINTICIHGKYLVTGNADGSVRFYDHTFKIVAWFEHLKMQQIKSISFSNCEPESTGKGDTDEKLDSLECSKFIIADSNAQVKRCRAF